MFMNPYNNIAVTGAEKGFSFGKALDDAGSYLMKNSQAAFGGRSYTVDANTHRVVENQGQDGSLNYEQLSFVDKAMAFIGHGFKKAAMTLSSDIKEKYQMVANPKAEKSETAEQQAPSVRKVTVEVPGGDFDCCIGCCKILGECR